MSLVDPSDSPVDIHMIDGKLQPTHISRSLETSIPVCFKLWKSFIIHARFKVCSFKTKQRRIHQGVKLSNAAKKRTATTLQLSTNHPSDSALSQFRLLPAKPLSQAPKWKDNNHISFPLIRRRGPLEGFVGRSLVSSSELRLSGLRTFACSSQVINISETSPQVEGTK